MSTTSVPTPPARSPANRPHTATVAVDKAFDAAVLAAAEADSSAQQAAAADPRPGLGATARAIAAIALLLLAVASLAGALPGWIAAVSLVTGAALAVSAGRRIHHYMSELTEIVD